MNAFSTVEETRHGGDWLAMVYSQSGQRTQCAVKIDVINKKKKHANCIKKKNTPNSEAAKNEPRYSKGPLYKTSLLH